MRLVKQVSLRPYPGVVRICANRKAFRRQHKELFGEEEIDLTHKRGRMVGHWDDKTSWPTYLVWGEAPAYLAHELAHVILHVFEIAGIDPREANGEPFCYMLSQLLIDAEK